jgi:DNA-directed RNA polymerase alpha subunit
MKRDYSEVTEEALRRIHLGFITRKHVECYLRCGSISKAAREENVSDQVISLAVQKAHLKILLMNDWGPLSTRSINTLKTLGYTGQDDLRRRPPTVEDILTTRNSGAHTVHEIESLLGCRLEPGSRLGMIQKIDSLLAEARETVELLKKRYK